MPLNFTPYPREDRGGELARIISEGVQNLGNTFLEGAKTRAQLQRQAMMDRYLQQEQAMKQREFAHNYQDPLIAPNPAGMGPRMEAQPMLGQPRGSSLIEQWKQRMGGGAPQTPRFAGVEENTDPYQGLSTEMARYASIPGAKGRADYIAGYKGIEGQALDRDLKERALQDQHEARRMAAEGRDDNRDLRRVLAETRVDEHRRKVQNEEAALEVPGLDRNPEFRASTGEVTDLRKAKAEYDLLLKNVSLLQELQKKSGTFEMFGSDAASMSQISEDIRLQAKNLYELGVLNGRDYELISNIVPSSRGADALFTRNSTRQTQYGNLKDLTERRFDTRAGSMGYSRQGQGQGDPLGLR
jgi:hypothetical protein